jgi:hypothetical protein
MLCTCPHLSLLATPAPAAARLHKVVEGQDIAQVAGVAYPHTSHCLGSGDIMISTMGAPDGKVRGRQNTKGWQQACCCSAYRLSHVLLRLQRPAGQLCWWLQPTCQLDASLLLLLRLCGLLCLLLPAGQGQLCAAGL